MAEENTFHIGLTMAGAISAGAYTGGVLDVLFEALDRHNARFESGRNAEWQGEFARHPRHKVALRVVSGTSAGGVSAGLAVAGLIGARSAEDGPGALQIGPKRDGDFTSRSGYSYSYRYILKPLHHVWVEALDLYRAEDGAEEGFLTTGDLRDRPVDSALNSEHIDAAAQAALAGINWNGKPYRFLTEDLDLFLITTNLQGIPYEVGFIAGAHDALHTHAMSQHSIVRHFRVSGLGTESHVSPWLEAWNDTGIALPLTSGEAVDFDRPGTPWARFKAAALATGAFPIGLAARVIDAEASDFGIAGEGGAITGGAWPINLKPGLTPDTRPKPKFSADSEPEVGPRHRVHYVAVDGGVANNEPFEFARYTLRRLCETDEPIQPGDKFLEANPRDPDTADCAVLMIDPFPEGPFYSPLEPEEARLLAGVVPAARNLFPALVNQARFKPGELIEATDKRVFSRYLLSPSRRERDDDGPAKLGAAAIACGSFGGFGGFFDRSFRAHDYMLGQRNAHSFLKRYFVLSREHEKFDLRHVAGPEDRQDMARVVDAGEDFYGPDLPLPVWPRLSHAELEPILDNAQNRISKIGGKILRDLKLSWFLRSVLGSVWSWDLFGGAGKKIGNALRRKVLAELIRRDQHEDFKEIAPGRPFRLWQRAVLLALAAAGDRPVPVALTPKMRRSLPADMPEPLDLVSAVENPGIGAEHVRAFLDSPEMRDRVWRTPWRAGEEVGYTLAALRPDYAWTHNLKAVTDRVSGLFGR